MKGTTQSSTAQITGVIVSGKVFEVQAGSYDVDTQGNERYITKDGKILQLKDSAVQGYILEEIEETPRP